jgi:acyl carrier protein
MLEQLNGLDGVREMICRVGKLQTIGPDDDFYEAGLSSVRALELLLELEGAYEVSIPDDDFITARTPRALHELIARIRKG